MLKERKNKYAERLNGGIDSPWFIAIIALCAFFSSAFGFELIYYTVCWIFGVYVLLFKKETHALIPLILSFYFSPSIQNNPGRNPQSVYAPRYGLEYIIFLIVTALIVYGYRIFKDVKNGKIKRSMPALSLGFVFLLVAFLSGGAGYEDYTPKTLVYGILVFASWSLLYFLFYFTVDWNRVPKEYFGWICLFLGLLVSAELLWAYRANGVVVNGEIVRSKIYVGWGFYNNVGCALVLFLPGIFYLAAKRKHGYVFFLPAAAVFVSVLLSRSRTSIAVAYVLAILCIPTAVICSKGKTRWIKATVAAAFVTAFTIYFYRNPQNVISLWNSLVNFKEDGISRIEIYEKGWALFLRYKCFGTGFYTCQAFEWTNYPLIIPPRWHNTYVQLFACCGILGMIAYLFHRAQTILLVVKKPNMEKIFLALGILGLIATSILDCHFFNIGPGLIYSAFLIFIEKQSKMKEKF